MIELPLEITEEDTFKTLFTKFGAYALDKQENLSNIIGDMEGELNIEEGLLSFGDDYNFHVQILGYLSLDSGDFSWAWDNDELGLDDALIEESKQVKEIGEKFNIPSFTTPMFNTNTEGAHFLSMIVISMFDDDAYYPAQIEDYIFFVTIKSDEIPEDNTIERFQIVFDSFQRDYEVNGKKAFEGYVALKGYPVNVHEEDDFQIAKIGDNRFMVGYTKRGNINLIKVIKPDD